MVLRLKPTSARPKSSSLLKALSTLLRVVLFTLTRMPMRASWSAMSCAALERLLVVGSS